MARDTRVGNLLDWLSALSMIGAIYMVFLYAPTEATMGHLQRIFYFHVSSAWVGFLAFFVTLVASIAYLRSRQRSWDIVALSSVEIGMVFTLAGVISGSIWAKPTWNAWWPWQQEPRLILVSALLLLYLAYGVLRAFIQDKEVRARFAAVYGILAFAGVPLTFWSVRWWQRLHPVVFERGGSHLAPAMLIGFIFCLVAFTLLYFTLLLHRTRLERLSDAVDGLETRLHC